MGKPGEYLRFSEDFYGPRDLRNLVLGYIIILLMYNFYYIINYQSTKKNINQQKNINWIRKKFVKTLKK